MDDVFNLLAKLRISLLSSRRVFFCIVSTCCIYVYIKYTYFLVLLRHVVGGVLDETLY
jgi:hypothetical protein